MDTVTQIIGLAMIGFAVYVELNAKKIMSDYQKSYKKPKNDVQDWFERPSKRVYWLNIFLVWPFVMLIGLLLILRTLI